MKRQLDKIDLEASNNLRIVWDRFRKNKGLSQTEFCESVGIRQSVFASYLNGHASIGLKMLVKISTALECNCSEIRKEVADRFNIC